MKAKELKTFGLITFWLTLLLVVLIVGFFQMRGNDFFYISEGETQRAITSDYMLREGYGPFNSITPVMGYPWPFPFEFPLYQFIAAKLVTPAVSLPLTGKIVSFLFFLAAVFLLFGILKKIGLPAGHSYFFLALLVSAPIYIAYSFSFTIETTAFFFFLAYLSGFISYVQNGKIWGYLLALLGGTLAAVVKITTFAVGANVVLLVAIWLAYRNIKSRAFSWKKTCLDFSLLIIPFACGLLWTFAADQVKLENPYGAMATSSALRYWVFGDMAMRLSPLKWLSFLARSGISMFGILGLVVLPGMVIRCFLAEKARKQLLWLALSLLIFLLGPLVFTNLYFVHDYYFMPTGVFLIWGLFILFPDGLKKTVYWALITGNLLTSFLYLHLKQLNYQNPVNEHITQSILRLPSSCTLIVFGAYFDSWIPYYSQKKALQTVAASFTDPVYQKALQRMKDQNVGVVIAKTATYAEIAAKTAQALGMDAKYAPSPEITLFFHSRNRPYLQLRPLRLPQRVNREIADLLKPLNGPGNRLLVHISRKSWLSVILAWNGTFFFFDMKSGFKVYSQKRFQLQPRSFELAMPETPKRPD